MIENPKVGDIVWLICPRDRYANGRVPLKPWRAEILFSPCVRGNRTRTGYGQQVDLVDLTLWHVAPYPSKVTCERVMWGSGTHDCLLVTAEQMFATALDAESGVYMAYRDYIAMLERKLGRLHHLASRAQLNIATRTRILENHRRKLAGLPVARAVKLADIGVMSRAKRRVIAFTEEGENA